MIKTGPIVFSAIQFSEESLESFRQAVPGAVIRQVQTSDPAVVAENISDAEIAVIYGNVDFDPSVAPNLRWVLTASAGVDALIGKKIWQSPVIITNASGIHAHSINELVWAMVLSLRHRLLFLRECQKKHVWGQPDPRSASAGELIGLTLGILGYGSIGREVGRLGKAFGMRLIATTLEKQDSGFTLSTAGDSQGLLPDVLAGPEFQRQLFSESDIIVCAVPSAPTTRCMVTEEDFKAMKQSALFVNIARGSVVDEQALIRALKEGWIAGAGLDVFEKEPLPADSPLWDMENVIITPHIAGGSPDYWKRLMTLLTENVQREQRGQTLLNVIDKSRFF